jgi:AraC-like DNA-binding protein
MYWESSGNVAFGYEKLVPRGTVDLIFNLAGPQQMFVDGDFGKRHTFRRVWVSGLFSKPLFVGPAYRAEIHGTHLVGVSIKPWALYGLFGVNAAELTNEVLEADELFGSQVFSTWEAIGAAETAEGRYEVLMTFLRHCQRRLARATPFSALWAAQETSRLDGNIRVEDLCAELSLSRKHLGSTFRTSVGMTPKSFARLVRFRSAMHHISSSGGSDLASLAIDLGFTDQAHLNKEFKAFAGDSPKRFLQSVSADGESILFEAER